MLPLAFYFPRQVPFVALALTVFFGSFTSPLSHAGALILNEFLASNAGGLQDEDGDYSDWFEIRNVSQTAVNLAAVSVTDNPLNPDKWTFPAMALPPNGYLLVFASEKDRRDNDGTELHTNFKLNRETEYFALIRNGSPTEVYTEFAPGYPEQRTDISYGYVDAAMTYRYFLEPTPGAPNGAVGIEDFLEDVAFNPPHGFYEPPLEVALSIADSSAEILYTKDGSLPSATNGLVYSTPFQVTQTIAIRAQAVRDGFFPSSVRTQTYLVGVDPSLKLLPAFSLATDESNLSGPTGIAGMSDPRRITFNPNINCSAWTRPDDLPTVYYNPSKRGRAWERPVSAEWIDPSDNSGFEVRCGIRLNGSDHTRARLCMNSKFSYRLYFRDVYGPANLLFQLTDRSPILEHDKIVLRGGLDDRINPFIRDELTRRVWIDMGYPGVQGTFAHLFINGEHKGYYNPVERPDQQFLQTWFDTDLQWDVVKRENDVVDGDLVAWNELLSYVLPFYTGAEPGIYEEIEARLDLENFIDYLLLNLYAATWDWPNNNWVAYRERVPGSKFRFLVWDAEGAWGYDGQDSTYNGFQEDLEGVTGNNREIPRLYHALLQSATFQELFADRVRYHLYNSGALTEANLMARYDELASLVGPAIPNFDNLPNNDFPDLDDDLSIGGHFLPSRREVFLLLLQGEGFDTSTPTPEPTLEPTATPTHTPEASSTPTATETRSTDLNGDNSVDAIDLLILLNQMRVSQ